MYRSDMGPGNSIAQQVREALVRARVDQGMTQDALAKKLGKQQSFVSNYERGERRIDVGEFVELSAALGVDAASLLSAIERQNR